MLPNCRKFSRESPGYKEKIQVISRKKAAENTLDLYGLVIFVLISSIGEIIYGLTCMLVVLIQNMELKNIRMITVMLQVFLGMMT